MVILYCILLALVCSASSSCADLPSHLGAPFTLPARVNITVGPQGRFTGWSFLFQLCDPILLPVPYPPSLCFGKESCCNFMGKDQNNKAYCFGVNKNVVWGEDEVKVELSTVGDALQNGPYQLPLTGKIRLNLQSAPTPSFFFQSPEDGEGVIMGVQPWEVTQCHDECSYKASCCSADKQCSAFGSGSVVRPVCAACSSSPLEQYSADLNKVCNFPEEIDDQQLKALIQAACSTSCGSENENAFNSFSAAATQFDFFRQTFTKFGVTSASLFDIRDFLNEDQAKNAISSFESSKAELIKQFADLDEPLIGKNNITVALHAASDCLAKPFNSLRALHEYCSKASTNPYCAATKNTIRSLARPTAKQFWTTLTIEVKKCSTKLLQLDVAGVRWGDSDKLQVLLEQRSTFDMYAFAFTTAVSELARTC